MCAAYMSALVVYE